MSQIGYGVPYRIDGPPPIPPMLGLLPAAESPAAGVRIVPDTDARGIERWMNGVEVYPYPPDIGDVFDACAGSGGAATKGFGLGLAHPQFGAMTVHIDETCTSYKVWSQEEFKARATATLSAVESGIIAFEFMTGTRMPSQPFLADGSGLFPNGDAATTAIHGLTILEREIARTRRAGLIHCSPSVATTLLGRGFALSDKSGVIRTINGLVIIPDFGYADGVAVAPLGHAAPAHPSQEWMYATGPVDIRRSELFTTPDNVVQATERGTGGANTGHPNSITYRAERYYLVDWDTELQAAVMVDLCGTDCVSGS